jgi:hypothetical protein
MMRLVDKRDLAACASAFGIYASVDVTERRDTVEIHRGFLSSSSV